MKVKKNSVKCEFMIIIIIICRKSMLMKMK